MLNRVRELLFLADRQGPLPLTGEPRRLTGRVRAGADGQPIQLELGGRSLRLYPDCSLKGDRRAVRDWILVDSEKYLNDISGFVRIPAGHRLRLGRADETCQRLFRFPTSVMRRQVEIANDDGRITISRIDPGGETYVHYVEDAEEIARPVASRLASLKAIRHIFGGPIELLPPAEALETLGAVNDILRDEAYRPRDALGQTGGLLDLPAEPTPVIVGDLHANLDNLLKILSEDGCLESLSRGEAILVILGDAVHPEGDEDLSQMDTSLLMLDLIFKLKIRFPRNVFYIRGNHDSFDELVSKAGVPQGLILKNRARKLRGPGYVEGLEAFFELLPYVVKTRDFIACHAGPPRRAATVADLVNIRNQERLTLELTWNRLRRPNRPGGYSKRHVNAFRANLGVDERTPFIVGHTPLSPDGTVWLDVGDIVNHHIVHSGNRHNMAVFIRVGKNLIPLVYRSEALLDLANALNITEPERAALAG